MPITNYLPSSRLIQPGVCTSATRPASPFEGQVIYETNTKTILIYNGSAWITTLPRTAVNTDITPATSGSYTNATASVSVSTGSSAWVTLISQGLSTSSGSTTLISFAVSGATTIAATDANSISHIGTSIVGKSRTILVTGLNNGVNTFTIASRASGSGGLASTPAITVQAII